MPTIFYIIPVVPSRAGCCLPTPLRSWLKREDEPSLRRWLLSPRLSCECAKVSVQGEPQEMTLDERVPRACDEGHDFKQIKIHDAKTYGIRKKWRDGEEMCQGG